jgi:hypothetical protein
MALSDLWKENHEQILNKNVQQVIAFAGDGKLTDGLAASIEFREYLKNIPSDVLAKYSDQCLADSFPNSGLALQDIVNEIGRRIGFRVDAGYYRGSPGHPGYDGLWTDESGHSILVEVKTTDAYRIDLNRIASYRRGLEKADNIDLERSSILVIVGRQDTGDLEAQIRGSKYSWEMRVISVGALLRVLKLKEDVDDPSIIARIHNILVPRDFTRLDQIVEIAFAAAEDIKGIDPSDEGEAGDKLEMKTSPVGFHAECIKRIEGEVDILLVRQTRASYASADNKIGLVCSISRFHEKAKLYWFAFHPYQDQYLSAYQEPYVAFGCGTSERLFLIPYKEFKPWLKNFSRTERPSRFYWHIKIRESGKSSKMIGKKGTRNFDIGQYLISS